MLRAIILALVLTQLVIMLASPFALYVLLASGVNMAFAKAMLIALLALIPLQALETWLRSR
tara:strand:- start:276 stop:458 length:183 start_codon:yes stop_codon:yes gene_type:complete